MRLHKFLQGDGCPALSPPHPFCSIKEREGEIYFQYPRFFVEKLQPCEADWKGRPRGVFLSLASVQFLSLASPRENPQVPAWKTRSQTPDPTHRVRPRESAYRLRRWGLAPPAATA